MKYPRTYHLPYSPGTTSDDKKLSDDWFSIYQGKDIVITEKLDGENLAINHFDCFARSHSSPTRSPWSRNIWEKDGILWKIKDNLSENETIYGENLFGEYSIHYDKLTSYWHMFAANNERYWYSWNDVKLMAEFLVQPTVPELFRGVVSDEEELERLVLYYVNQPSVYGKDREGVVVRIADEFPIDEFSSNVCKWVRPNHVTTNEHWTKNWTKAELIEKS